ncbi:SPFH domain-containing protein [Streptomyces sp. TLI_55]|uniref:SPFH domain-containing protein n=1 Tax=Streptomyces sp. TLI_55 TaxID=1938861 RepID=UPI00211C6D03|nr:SPFH domain-containing protein [Streptomyces sp. TLI_55]
MILFLILFLAVALAVAWNARVIVPADHVGIITRRYVPQHPDRAYQHVNPHNARGVLARTLSPGVHWLWPVFNSVDCVPRVHVPQDMIGVVTALEGQNRSGRGRLARHVDCDNFQDGVGFLLGGPDGAKGEQGIQLRTLSGGQAYYINTRLFRVEMRPRTYVPPGTIGLVQAREGGVRPPDQRFGRHVPCESFQDGEAFLAGGGEQGRQLAILGGGNSYDINPELFDVITVDNVAASREGLTEAHLREISIKEDYTGVVIALDGADPGQEADGAVAPLVPGHRNFRLPWVFLENGGQRGVQQETLGKGPSYALNPWFVRVLVIPTRVLILKWHNKQQSEADNYDADLGQITVKVQGRFELSVDLWQNLQIPPRVAPALVSQFGGDSTPGHGGLGGLVDDPAPMKRFVRDVLGVAVTGYFNEIAMTYSVFEFLDSYEDVRKNLTDRVKHALGKWGVKILETNLGDFEPVDPSMLEALKAELIEEMRGKTLDQAVKNAEREDIIDKYLARAEARRVGLEIKAEVEALGRDNVAMIRIVREFAGFDVPQYIGGGGDISAYLSTMPLPAVQDLLARLRQLRLDQQLTPGSNRQELTSDDAGKGEVPTGTEQTVSTADLVGAAHDAADGEAESLNTGEAYSPETRPRT